MHPMLTIATRAARAAGNIIIRAYERTDTLIITEKTQNDFVTKVDLQAEQEIINTIRKSYPNHGILAEESGTKPGDDYQWIIDPLDGTTNYIHKFPHFAVSIAIQHRQQLEHAVIYNPLADEMFLATRGSGARVNDRRMRVSQRSSLSGALLGTGIPFREDQDLASYLTTLSALLPGTAGVRRAGSAALDLAFVAAGRLDGFWELGLKPWDMAAGILMIQEAGGIVSDIQGNNRYLETGHLITANPKVHQAMLKSIQQSLTTT